MDGLVKEPIEITSHPNINREVGLKLSIARIQTRILRHSESQSLGTFQEAKLKEE
jgi:hypothetical protein